MKKHSLLFIALVTLSFSTTHCMAPGANAHHQVDGFTSTFITIGIVAAVWGSTLACDKAYTFFLTDEERAIKRKAFIKTIITPTQPSFTDILIQHHNNCPQQTSPLFYEVINNKNHTSMYQILKKNHSKDTLHS